MPSPFPGMDPWLETPSVFPTVHKSIIVYIMEAINATLPDNYIATIEELVWIDPEVRRIPDVSVYGPDNWAKGYYDEGSYQHDGMLAVLAEPIMEPWEQPYLEIVSDNGERLVTAIEILSPSNKKAGEAGRVAYQQKQQEFRLGGVHMVEIDLLRGGQHTTMIPKDRLNQVAGTFDYHTCVTVVGEQTRHYIKPFMLSDRLPTIVIPLDPGVTPIKVELQTLFDRAYDTGRYTKRVKYQRACDPPLTTEQQNWANAILREKELVE